MLCCTSYLGLLWSRVKKLSGKISRASGRRFASQLPPMSRLIQGLAMLLIGFITILNQVSNNSSKDE